MISGIPSVYGRRRFERIALPKGMDAAWHGGGDQQVSRVKNLGMGGMFLAASHARVVGTNLKLIFAVPNGIVQAEGIVRNVVPGEGMGVEFVKMGQQDLALLEGLLGRLLQ